MLNKNIETSVGTSVGSIVNQKIGVAVVIGTGFIAAAGLAGFAFLNDGQNQINSVAVEQRTTNPPQAIPGWPMNTGVFLPHFPSVYDLNGDGNQEILVGMSTVGKELVKIGIYQVDGSPFPGWPADPISGYAHVSTSAADIDGNGQLEIIAALSGTDDVRVAKVFVWNLDGTVVSGWPQELGEEYNYSSFDNIAVADIDGDDSVEIVAESRYGMFAWHTDGAAVSGWPVIPNNFSFDSLAVVDLDNNGTAEVITTLSRTRLAVYAGSGEMLPDWPKPLGGYYGVNTLAVGNIDADPEKEIVIGGSDGEVAALNIDGNFVSGWPVIVTDGDYRAMSPTLADITGDGILEIFAGSGNGYVYAWKSDGSPMPNWPYNTNQSEELENWILTGPSFADVTGDSNPEIFVGSKYGYLYAFTQTAQLLPGFPIIEPGAFMFSPAPVLADLVGNSNPEILVAAIWSNTLYAWEFFPTSLTSKHDSFAWLTYKHDSGRSAAYSPPSPLGAAQQVSNESRSPLTGGFHVSWIRPTFEFALRGTVRVQARTSGIDGESGALKVFHEGQIILTVPMQESASDPEQFGGTFNTSLLPDGMYDAVYAEVCDEIECHRTPLETLFIANNGPLDPIISGVNLVYPHIDPTIPVWGRVVIRASASDPSQVIASGNYTFVNSGTGEEEILPAVIGGDGRKWIKITREMHIEGEYDVSLEVCNEDATECWDAPSNLHIIVEDPS